MSDWIPIKYRKMDEEEKEYYLDYLLICDRVDFIYDCILPEDGQEVIITTKNGNVTTTTYYEDCGYCYFENYEDFDDVLAWMPLPEAYKKVESYDQS